MEIIPPLAYIDPDSYAELKTARLLATIDSEGSCAFHSFHLPIHRRQQMGEADFVVLWQGAILVLEVKGGSLKRKDGVWYQTGRSGTHQLPKSPWVQARAARFALEDALADVLPGSSFSFCAAVVTPDCVMAADAEWGSWEHVGSDRFTRDGLTQALNALARQARTLSGGRRAADGTGLRPRSDLTGVRKSLRRDIDRLTTRADEDLSLSRRLVELLPDQADLLDAVRVNPRLVVEGGAGTGKTLVAIECAKREALAGVDVIFTCGSRAVLDTAKQLLKGTSVRVTPVSEMPSQECDLLVVDEAQDLMNTDDVVRLFDSVHGGIGNGRWWLLLDSNNQAHVTGNFDREVFDELSAPGTAVKLRLRRNVRNTKSTIDAVQQYLNADIGSAGLGAGVALEMVKTSSQSELREQVDSTSPHCARGESQRRTSVWCPLRQRHRLPGFQRRTAHFRPLTTSAKY